MTAQPRNKFGELGKQNTMFETSFFYKKKVQMNKITYILSISFFISMKNIPSNWSSCRKIL